MPISRTQDCFLRGLRIAAGSPDFVFALGPTVSKPHGNQFASCDHDHDEILAVMPAVVASLVPNPEFEDDRRDQCQNPCYDDYFQPS